MSNFNKAFDLILEDIIQSVTPEELKERQAEYSKIKVKKVFEKLSNQHTLSKNPDGTYDVDSNIDLYNMDLTSLLDLPYKLNKVNGFFDCSFNKLTNLVGSPRIVEDAFSCTKNNLDSLEGLPVEIKGDLWIRNMDNFFKFKEADIRKVCKVGGQIHLI